jgi:HEAT repeat protein
MHRIAIIISCIGVFAGAAGVHAADEPGVPALMKILEDPAAKVDAKRDACARLARLGPAARPALGALIKLAVSDDPRLRSAGVEAVGLIGEDFERAVPILIQALKDREVAIRDKASLALSRMGLAVIPELIKATRDENALTRAGALAALSYFGGEAQAAAPAIFDALRDQDEMVYRMTCIALREMKLPGPAVPKALLKTLEDSGKAKAVVDRKLTAMWVLAAYGKDASPAVESLRILAQSDDRELRLEAARTLAVIGAELDTIRPILQTELRKGQPLSRLMAAEALWQIGEPAEPLVAVVIAVLNDKNWKNYLQPALALLDRMGPDAVAGLIKSIENESSPFRAEMVQTLAGIGRDAADAVPALLRIKSGKNEQLAQTVLGALSDLSEPNKDVLTALTDGLKSASAPVRARAARSLAVYGPGAAPVLPALAACLKDGESNVRESALYALGRLGVAGTAAIGDIEKLLNGGSDRERLFASVAIAGIRKDHPEAKKLIRSILKDEKSPVRMLALEALSTLGADAVDLRPDVAALLQDSDPAIRSDAALALWWMGIDAEAVRALCSALKDSAEEVRSMAAFALSRAPLSASAPAIAVLRQALADRSVDVRIQAAVALLRLDTSSAEARAKLKETYSRLAQSLEDAQAAHRDAVQNEMTLHNLAIFELLGPDAAGAKAALTIIARRATDPRVSEAALRAFKKVAPDK